MKHHLSSYDPNETLKHSSKLTNKLSWITAGALLTLLIIYWVASFMQFNSALHKHIDKNMQSISQSYHNHIERQISYLEGSLQLLNDNDAIRQAFINKDRQTLLTLTQPLLENAFKPNHITHFYFTDADGVNFIRIHDPSRYGDKILRTTQVQAKNNDQITTGIEVGMLGTLTLRSVMPWHDNNGNTIGYIELGIDILQIVKQLSRIEKHPMFLALNKNLFTPEDWDNGAKPFGESRMPWGFHPNLVVSADEESLTTPNFTLPNLEKTIEISKQANYTNRFDIAIDWQAIPLYDVHSKPVGYLFVSLELKSWSKSFQHDVLVSSLIFILVSILLVVAINHFGKRIRHAESRAHETIEQLNFMASYDKLTGLPNRELFLFELEQHIKEAQRFGHELALCFLDIDDFKKINDTLGHSMGDQLLVHVSRFMSDQLRDCDILSRFGGDEFVLLLPQSDLESTAQILPRLLLTDKTFEIDEQTLHVSTSIGISNFPQDGKTAEELLKHADTAMYHAKHEGKNRYHFFEEKMNLELHHQHKTEKLLRKAIEDNELQVFYQPQFDLHTGQLISFEALVRWITADGIVIPPNDFLPVAENTRLIAQIDDYVFEEVCRQAKRWQQQGHELHIDINLSGKHIHDLDIAAYVNEKLQRYQLDICQIGIEITESTLIQARPSLVEQFRRLRKEGLTLSLDDFGTGYSSLSYLKNFPVSVLKIDQAFVRDAPFDSNDYSLMKAIVAMGHSLGITVIAEGIETIQHETVAKELHCDRVQGYLYQRPLPADEIDIMALKKLTAQSPSHPPYDCAKSHLTYK
ncbi:MAG: EAL domain-containing protein [Thiomicrorhabdus sp.]|nr:EAL domain-containing protein [Thiomicrorhabdus sp.]